MNLPTHIFHKIDESSPKPRALLKALLLRPSKKTAILCHEREECELLQRFLSRYGFTQNSTFFITEHGKAIDLPDNLELIINYDVPERAQQYDALMKHLKGESNIVSLVSSRELSNLGSIKSQSKIDFLEESLPDDDTITKAVASRMIAVIKQVADETELGPYLEIAAEASKENAAPEALALLLKNYFSAPKEGPRPPREDRRPRSSHDDRGHRDRREPRAERTPNDRYEPREPRPERAPNERYEPREPRTERPPQDRYEPREPRAERAPNDRYEPRESPPQADDGITRLYVTLGRQDGINDLATLAQHLSNVSGVDLGHFSASGMVRDNSSHIEVDSDVAEEIINALNGSLRPGEPGDEQENNKVLCERARQNSGPSRRPPQRRHNNFRRRS